MYLYLNINIKMFMSLSTHQPTNKKLYARVKAQTKRKFAVYPSAYANAWLVRTYKAKGGKYRMGTK